MSPNTEHDGTADQEARLDVLKAQLAQLVLAADAADVYDVETSSA